MTTATDNRRPILTIVNALAIAGAMITASSAVAADEVQYNRDVLPILRENCFACHGPDSAARQADLRLDQRDAAIDAYAITPGKPDESEMIYRISSEDPDEVMPPPETKKSLTEEQKQTLAKWIEQGAEYELHWSFIPPVRPDLPAVEQQGWVRNPIDNFVLANLESQGLTPNGDADLRTLARRVALDLTGLPPSPEMVEEFLRDALSGVDESVINSPAPAADLVERAQIDAAYARYVDRLLAMPQWGEHRGRYWLDYARYADTNGIHFDNYREMWSYRDWVIGAFNRNLPFDEFTIESLAGDLLPDPTLDQVIGSGFNRCNMTTNEGGIIDEEYRVLYARDRVETTSQVWLGLTAGCAVCHSHKFDPLSQREFYELSAFFNNTTQPVRDGNVKDTPPVVAVPLPEDRPRWSELEAEIPAQRQVIEARRQSARPEFNTWLATATPESLGGSLPVDDLYLHAVLDEGEGKTVDIQIDGAAEDVTLTDAAGWQEGISGPALQVQGGACELPEAGRFEKDQPFTCTAWVNMPASDGNGAICSRMDRDSNYRGWDFWTQRRQIGMHIINSWPGNGLKVVGKAQVPANKWVHVAVSYDGSGKAAGVKVYYNGQPQQTNVENDKLSATIQTDVPFKIGQRSNGEAYTGGLQDLRIYTRVLNEGEVASLANLTRYAATLAKAPEDRTNDERNELYDFWLTSFDDVYQTESRTLADLEREQNAIQARGTVAHVMQEKNEPAMAYVLYRGEYDQRQDEVAPGTPEVLPGFPEDYPRNRLGLARWLLLDDQPLTARVTVNRFWQEVFGTGIVRTAGDFGVAGELPVNQDLLDWLAVEFRESGWDIKGLFRLIVTSSTYRQSAAVTPEKVAADPENRLLSRGPRFRMDAEMVRDYALAASGLLVDRIGGPSVKPYQPEGVWAAIAMNVSNTRKYEPGTGDDLYRRSMYWFWKRMAPPASMDIFNAPKREFCVVRRERTDTPLQALVTLNDEQFVEAARHLAERALTEGGQTFEERVDFIARRLLARPLRAEELTIIRNSLDGLQAFYGNHADDAAALIAVGESESAPSLDAGELAAWTMLTNELMNLDEVLNK